MEPVADECMVLDAGRLVAREKGIPARLLTPYLAEERAALQGCNSLRKTLCTVT